MASNTVGGVMTPFKKSGNQHNPLMIKNEKRIIRRPNGEIEIDPMGHKDEWRRFLEKLKNGEEINYAYFNKSISNRASELMVSFLLDLSIGRNMAKGTKRGPRSPQCVCGYKNRLPTLIRKMEAYVNKEFIDFTEDDAIKFFNAMREGIVRNKIGKPYTDIRSYVKTFRAFWRWYIRISKKEDLVIPDICASVDSGNHNKPPWHFFTLDDVRKIINYAPSLYYKALVLFLFDSGIRAPKEMMNVRVKDITPIPNSKNVFLQIRDSTSKTFGRKIKLMICSEVLQCYIKETGKTEEDFLFTKSYNVMSQVIKRMAFKALGYGKEARVSGNKVSIHGGISMYDFRHSSVCHYLPIYDSENQMKYRYGWKKADMIHYYSEFMGMKDNITDDDMVVDSTKPQLQLELEKERQKVHLLEEKMMAQQKMLEERMKKFEEMLSVK